MALTLGFFLIVPFIRKADNTSTFAQAWRYPDQADGCTPVSLTTLNAWVLLMIVSFMLITLVNRPNRETDHRASNTE